MYDLAFRGRVYAGRPFTGWVYVSDGKIAKVSREAAGPATTTIQLESDQTLIPAATDLHVHLRDWAQSEKETVETGTMSAVAGGVTTVAEMPNTRPVLDTAERIDRRVELLRRKSYADFAVHAAVPVSEEDLRGLRKAGAFAIKFYPPDLSRLPPFLRASRRAGLRVAVHAEDDSMTRSGAAGRAEIVAVRRILRESSPGDRVRFAHVSTYQGASAIVASRPSHRGLTAEVTPHHLFMSSSLSARRIGRERSRVNPPLRSSANASKIRRLMGDGAFDFYATDHAPHTAREKAEGAPGFSGLEIALPLLMTKTDDLALTCRLYCEAPAAYLGVRKGRIQRGYSADLVVLGRRRWSVDPSKFVSKGRVTPFEGEELSYSVDAVFIRGAGVYSDARFTRVPTQLVAAEQLH